jgi:hypothetical protein
MMSKVNERADDRRQHKKAKAERSERRLALEERKLELEERKLAIEALRMKAITPEEYRAQLKLPVREPSPDWDYVRLDEDMFMSTSAEQ